MVGFYPISYKEHMIKIISEKGYLKLDDRKAPFRGY